MSNHVDRYASFKRIAKETSRDAHRNRQSPTDVETAVKNLNDEVIRQGCRPAMAIETVKFAVAMENVEKSVIKMLYTCNSRGENKKSPCGVCGVGIRESRRTGKTSESGENALVETPCVFTHSFIEEMYHPMIYKSTPCTNHTSWCMKVNCPYYHSTEERDMWIELRRRFFEPALFLLEMAATVKEFNYRSPASIGLDGTIYVWYTDEFCPQVANAWKASGKAETTKIYDYAECCTDGEQCKYTHTFDEYYAHPLAFKAYRCRKAKKHDEKKCCGFHTHEEERKYSDLRHPFATVVATSETRTTLRTPPSIIRSAMTKRRKLHSPTSNRKVSNRKVSRQGRGDRREDRW